MTLGTSPHPGFRGAPGFHRAGLVAAALAVGGFSGAQAQSADGTEAAELYDPIAIHLYWRQDPTTTMLIDWQTLEGQERDTVIQYRPTGTAEEWATQTGDTRPFPHSDRTIHRVELSGLEPGTTYDFRFGEDSVEYKLRTMPATAERPVRVVFGGDTLHHQQHMERVNREAMRYDPEFYVWGGDLAYADANPERVHLWYDWYESMKKSMITPEGRVIPAVVGIGNHEVQQYYYFRHEDYEPTDEFRESIASFFFGLFDWPGQPGYDVLDFGDYMSIVMLDTDHANPIEGEQTEWLEQVLAERQDVPHLFPVYHVPGYPSHNVYGDQVNVRVRDVWMPLFEKFGVRVAFENHDHTYKRTHPIRGEQLHPAGIVYIGDGAWGVVHRPVHDPEETWFLKRAEPVRHFILATLHGAHHHFLMVDEYGNVIDEYPEAPTLRWSREEVQGN